MKPLDTEMIERLAIGHDLIVTVEEGVLQGGFGSAVLEHLEDNFPNPGGRARVLRIGLPDRYVTHGKPNLLLEEVGLPGARGAAERVQAALGVRAERPLSAQPGGFKGLLRVSERSVENGLFLALQHPSRRGLGLDSTAPASVVDVPDEHRDIANRQDIINLGLHDVPGVVELVIPAPRPFMAAKNVSAGRMRMRVPLTSGSDRAMNGSVSFVEHFDQPGSKFDVSLRHGPLSIPRRSICVGIPRRSIWLQNQNAPLGERGVSGQGGEIYVYVGSKS